MIQFCGFLKHAITHRDSVGRISKIDIFVREI